jgi:hypothetical protein
MADNCDIVTHFPGEVTAANSLQTFAVSTQGYNVGALTLSSGPNVSTSFCHLETPVLTQGKAFRSYALPWDFQVWGVLQSLPGPIILANAVFTSSQIAPSLGRALSAASAVTINIVKPGSMWGPRLNQVDLKVAILEDVMFCRTLMTGAPALGLYCFDIRCRDNRHRTNRRRVDFDRMKRDVSPSLWG